MSRSNALRYYVMTRLLLAPLMIWTITTVVFLFCGRPLEILWMRC